MKTFINRLKSGFGVTDKLKQQSSDLATKFRHGLARTRTSIGRNVKGIFTSQGTWGEDEYEALEAALIGADLGVAYTTRLVEDVRARYARGEIATADDIIQIAREDVSRIMHRDDPPLNLAADGPTVVLFVGVNGSGKTTTAGKLAQRCQAEGNTVLMAACDTFRAAAIKQLQLWGERVGCDVVAGADKGDAAAVAYDACKRAQRDGIDLVLIDTAGRQHTSRQLMDELAKIHRTIGKALPGAPHETWLVVDGSAGSNGLLQAREFGKAMELTGICLTKLDGTSKGGIVVAIHEELELPVRFVGLGEAPEDLQLFDADAFAEAMFPRDLVQ